MTGKEMKAQSVGQQEKAFVDRETNMAMTSAGAKAWRGLEKFIVLLGKIGALSIIAIMILTSADVVLRYIVGSPIKGAYEISEILFLSAVFLGLAYTQVYKEHVQVEVLTSLLPLRAQVILETFMLLLALFIYVILGWQGTEDFVKSVASGEYRWGLIQIPLWPARLMIPLGASVLCLRLFGEIVLNLRSLLCRRKER